MTSGEVALVTVSGLVDEHFAGFGAFSDGVKSAVINVAGMTRMTSFGVRQWLKGMDAIPKSIGSLYLLGCPTFFVDQLNMVLNFGGAAQVLTVLAPYTCPSCGVESGEVIDVLADRAALAKGGISDKECRRCGGKLEFDETPESYFSFVSKYAATSIEPATAAMLGQLGLYTAVDIPIEKPPRIIKLVHGSVTYFRIIGTVGSMFRARPFLVGAEGEVVIDLAEVESFDQFGNREWKRLIKTLAGQVPTITLVDVTESFLQTTSDSIVIARNISVSSVLAPYRCNDCDRASFESKPLDVWPPTFDDGVCSLCGGVTRSELRLEMLAPLQKASTTPPPASAKLISQRAEILSRALTDANVAQAGDNASAAIANDDTILGKFKIVRRLSQGGMAEVFLAKQIGIGGFEKPVALKRIQRQLLETRHLAIDLFLNEAKIAGRLMHPNIVQVLDVGEVGGALFLAMEYVHGKDLRDLIKKLRTSNELVPIGEACYIMREIAQALHHAYWSTDMSGNRLSVVHRDVSPHNVMLGYDGTVKLLDFGVALSAVTEQAKTMIVGKWGYMSPEHTMNQAIDHRSDLFSLGIIMYQMLTGGLPFSGNDPKEIVRKIRGGQFKPLVQAAPDIPGVIASLVDRLLSPNPADRPQTGMDVVNELTDIARGYGLERSATNMAKLLNRVFGEEPQGVVMELVKTELVDPNPRVAVGSGPGIDNSKSPSSFPSGPFSTSYPAPAGYSESLPAVRAPRQQSVELPPPGTYMMESPEGYRPPPQPPQHSQPLPPAQALAVSPSLGRDNRWMVALVVGVLAVLVVLAYLVVRPK